MIKPRGGARGEALRELDANQDYWQARVEAAERELEMVKRERVHRSDFEAVLARAEAAEDRAERYAATLAAVREWRAEWSRYLTGPQKETLDALLDREGEEGEKCPTCGGRGIVASGPDEFGNYDTDDCPDEWHR